jgi:hypothetical protein
MLETIIILRRDNCFKIFLYQFDAVWWMRGTEETSARWKEFRYSKGIVVVFSANIGIRVE